MWSLNFVIIFAMTNHINFTLINPLNSVFNGRNVNVRVPPIQFCIIDFVFHKLQLD